MDDTDNERPDDTAMRLAIQRRTAPVYLSFSTTRATWDLLVSLAADGLHGAGVVYTNEGEELSADRLRQVEREAVEKVAEELLRRAVRDRFDRA